MDFEKINLRERTPNYATARNAPCYAGGVCAGRAGRAQDVPFGTPSKIVHAEPSTFRGVNYMATPVGS